jgi:hypothetical protein
MLNKKKQVTLSFCFELKDFITDTKEKKARKDFVLI